MTYIVNYKNYKNILVRFYNFHTSGQERKHYNPIPQITNKGVQCLATFLPILIDFSHKIHHILSNTTKRTNNEVEHNTIKDLHNTKIRIANHYH